MIISTLDWHKIHLMRQRTTQDISIAQVSLSSDDFRGFCLYDYFLFPRSTASNSTPYGGGFEVNRPWLLCP